MRANRLINKSKTTGGLIKIWTGITLDNLADTHGFEGDFVHQLAVGRHAGDKVQFETSIIFEYTKSLK